MHALPWRRSAPAATLVVVELGGAELEADEDVEVRARSAALKRDLDGDQGMEIDDAGCTGLYRRIDPVWPDNPSTAR